MKLHDPIPSFDGAARWIGGGPVHAEQLRGRPVLIHIWSSVCPECKLQFDSLQRWAEQFEPRGLQIVGLHARSAPEQRDEDAIALIEKHGLGHPIALDALDAPVTRRFGARFVPSYYVFDAEGRLRHRQAGYHADVATEAAIRHVLDETAGAATPA